MVWFLHQTGLRSLPETQSEDLWVGGLWAAAAVARPLMWESRWPRGPGWLLPVPAGGLSGPCLGSAHPFLVNLDLVLNYSTTC